jgi:hypothetical protein
MKNTGFKWLAAAIFLSAPPFPAAATAPGGGPGNTPRIKKDIRNLTVLVSKMKKLRYEAGQARKGRKTEVRGAAGREARLDALLASGRRRDAWVDINFLWSHWKSLTPGEKMRVHQAKDYLVFES